MDKRLTWDEIKNKLRYTDKTQGELARLQIDNDNLYGCYTTPDHLAQPQGIVTFNL